MIKITIGKKKYSGIYRWDEMSLRKFIQLSVIPIPEGYEAYVLADGKYDHTRMDTVEYYTKVVSELTDQQIKEEFPAYYRKVCLCLSDVPGNMLTDDMVTELYELYFRPFVCTLIYNAPVISFMGELKDYTSDHVQSFKVGSECFCLPESITLSGQDIPLAKEPIISYSEASDLFRDLKLTKEADKLSRFMAIYCRKKSEEYSDEIVLYRQELMLQVPMSTVWSVFFCITKQLPSYIRPILLSGIHRGGVEAQRKQVRHLLGMVHAG
jgi:hypothetical protein